MKELPHDILTHILQIRRRLMADEFLDRCQSHKYQPCVDDNLLAKICQAYKICSHKEFYKLFVDDILETNRIWNDYYA